ncbi:HNH endonuclease [Cronobacter malonaticus]
MTSTWSLPEIFGGEMADKSKRIPLPSREMLLSIFNYEASKGELWWRESGFNRQMDVPCGYVSGGGYLSVKINGRLCSVHRLIWKMHMDSEPQHLDHVNGNRLDNRIENLRPAIRNENNRNISVTRANTSGYIGVRFDARYKRWVAQIKIERKAIFIGSYETKVEAVHAYNDAAIKMHGDFAHRKILFNQQQLINEFGGLS